MNRLDITALLAALLAVLSLGEAWRLSRQAPGLDFYQFWVGAQVAGRADLENFYSEESATRLGAEFLQRARVEEGSRRRLAIAEHRQHLEFYSTPFLYSTFGLFAGGTYERDLLRFQLVSLACGFAALLGLGLLFRFPPAVGFLLVMLFTLGFQPLRADLRASNVNQLQLAWLTLALWLLARPGDRSRFWAGIALGALLAFKPNTVYAVALLLVAWVLERRYGELRRMVAGLAVSGAGAFLLGSWTFGSFGSWFQWLHKLSNIPPEILPLGFGNFGLVRLLEETRGLHLAMPLTAFCMGLALFAIFKGRRLKDGESSRELLLRDGLTLGLGCLVTFLASPLVWQHYLLLVAPVLVVLWARAQEQDDVVFALLVSLGWTAVAISPWTSFFGLENLMHQAVLVNLGLVLLFGLTLRERMRLGESPSNVSVSPVPPGAPLALPGDGRSEPEPEAAEASPPGRDPG